MITEKKLCILILILCVIGISLIIVSATILDFQSNNKEPITESLLENEKIKYVYIYLESIQDDTVSSPPTSENSDIWIIKSYLGKIGIFEKSGTLYKVLDVYVKTLPKADQVLLEEGFEVNSKEELYSIIEDYTS